MKHISISPSTVRYNENKITIVVIIIIINLLGYDADQQKASWLTMISNKYVLNEK